MADASKAAPAAPEPTPAKKTIKVEILRKYWPKDQTVENPDPLTTNEVVHQVGDVVDLPEDEALDLIELGAAKQYRGR